MQILELVQEATQSHRVVLKSVATAADAETVVVDDDEPVAAPLKRLTKPAHRRKRKAAIIDSDESDPDADFVPAKSKGKKKPAAVPAAPAQAVEVAPVASKARTMADFFKPKGPAAVKAPVHDETAGSKLQCHRSME